MKLFVTRTEVADRLGITPATFDRRRPELEDEEGFPLPMPQSRRPLLWRRDQLELWIEAQGRPKADPLPLRPLGPNVVLLEEARRA